MLLDSPTGTATYLPLHGSNNETEIILLTFFTYAICPHWLCATYVYPKPIIYSIGNMIANITAV